MKNVEFLSVLIHFSQLPDRKTLDLGTVTLKKDNREYELDIISSHVETENDIAGNIICGLEEFTFENGSFSKNNLSAKDLASLDSATIYLGDNLNEKPEFVKLFVRYANLKTLPIELTIES